MFIKPVGQVTPEEKLQIQRIFERKNGLTELAKVLPSDNSELYERIVKDMGETEVRFQQWWNDMAQKYQLESIPNGHWEINFNNGEIYLHK